MQKLSLLLLLPSSFASISWQEWKQKHSMSFSHREDAYRETIFRNNHVKVLNHNKRFSKGLETFTMDLTKFAHLTEKEFLDQYTIKKDPVLDWYTQYTCTENYNGGVSASEVDWRSQNNPKNKVLVTAVKDQGNCGSCWTFGATGTLEGQACQSDEHDCTTWPGLSEQHILDCASFNETFLGEYNDYGCIGGGEQSNALRWLWMNGGVSSEELYPYKAKDGTCQNPTNVFNTQDKCGTTSFDGANAELLQSAVYNIGPVTVGIDVERSLQLYSGGIYSARDCTLQ